MKKRSRPQFPKGTRGDQGRRKHACGDRETLANSLPAHLPDGPFAPALPGGFVVITQTKSGFRSSSLTERLWFRTTDHCGSEVRNSLLRQMLQHTDQMSACATQRPSPSRSLPFFHRIAAVGSRFDSRRSDSSGFPQVFRNRNAADRGNSGHVANGFHPSKTPYSRCPILKTLRRELQSGAVSQECHRSRTGQANHGSASRGRIYVVSYRVPSPCQLKSFPSSPTFPDSPPLARARWETLPSMKRGILAIRN